MGNKNVFVRRHIQTTIQIVAALAVTILLAISYSAVAGAENTANTLKVSPVRTDVEIKPGERRVVKVTVTNVTDASIKVHPATNDFISGDERGTPSLILDENKFAPTHSLKRFMSPLSDVTIPAKESKTIGVVISVPSDAQAGGYFGAIRFAPSKPDDGGQVNLSASVASLILLKVPGDAVEKLALTDFEIKQNGKEGFYFGGSDNLEAAVRFKNEGGVQVGPFGKVSVKQGDKVIYEADFNNKAPRDMVLPDSARRWEVPLKNVQGFGYYTVYATFTYGDKNQTIEVSKSFWVIPMIVVIGAIVGLLVLIGLIVAVWLSIRRRNHRRRSHRQHRGGLRHK